MGNSPGPPAPPRSNFCWIDDVSWSNLTKCWILKSDTEKEDVNPRSHNNNTRNCVTQQYKQCSGPMRTLEMAMLQLIIQNECCIKEA